MRTELPFRLDLVEFLADHRLQFLTPLLQLFTFLGELEGYILIIVLLYAAYDKKLAIRLAVLTLVTMSVNHALKTMIRNPRPFIGDGSYKQRWAVSAERAADLATEYSTPSGHAMAGASFYTYLYGVTANRYARAAFVACILLTGFSRPYLGVHYGEDVLIGWVLGLALALLAVRYGASLERRWSRVAYATQVASLVATSLGIWLVTRAVSDWSTTDPPSAFVSYAGLLTGILAGQPLEASMVNFDPKAGGPSSKLLRYVLCVAVVLGTLEILGRLFAMIAVSSSPLGHLLRYLRYSAAGFIGIFVAPLLFVRLRLVSNPAYPRAPS